MLTGKRLSDAARRSTERYLTFLTEQERGVEKHDVEGIRRLDNGQQLLEGSVWHTYACDLQPGLKVRGNTGGILQCGSRADLEVRILQYDRRSGYAEIATREEVDCTTGRLLIDFRWLVRRTLEWYREHGSSLPGLAEITAPARPSAQLAHDSGLSTEQEQAIETALTTPVAYIWGPPGTGKTKWVLAKAVELCVSGGEKVLVLAPTNNAIDNALRAILGEGVSPSAVLRVGVPTKQFLADFPDCCEERAFVGEIAEISAQILALEKRIARIKKGRELQTQAGELRDSLDAARQELTEKETESSRLKRDLGELESRLAILRGSLSPRERRLEALEAQLADLRIPEIQENIDALEDEQSRAIKERSELQQSLDRVGLFAKLLSNRPRKLADQIASITSHLHATEATLERQRAKLAESTPASEALECERSKLTESCQAEWETEKELQNLAGEAHTTEAKLAADIDRLKNSCEVVQSRLRKAETELSTLADEGVGLNEDNEELEKQLEAQKEALSAQLAKYKQDMANKAVLGMTLDGFIGLTLQIGLSVDRVFVDEAPYAPLAKCIPLLSLRRPLTLLGDHLQLPPICECDNDEEILAYWGKPSVFLEDAFKDGENARALCDLDEPRFNLMNRQILRKSYRFGQSLASLLDTHIYSSIGLEGVADSDTFIECRACTPREVRGRRKRENHAEAEAIVREVEKRLQSAQGVEEELSLAVLTPYKYQAQLIRRLLREHIPNAELLYQVEVIHTHLAQGREWDFVMFSVADTGSLPRNKPWFTDSNRHEARALLNTTISRAKQQLIVFMDSDYWRTLPQSSLLTDMALRSQTE